jgi:hypothetical protein
VHTNFTAVIYKMMVKSVVVYGCETWAVAEVGMKRLNTRERKILRRITNGRARDTENKNKSGITYALKRAKGCMSDKCDEYGKL